MQQAVILGGGLSGLSAADILNEKYDVTVIEKNNFLGGLAASFKQGGEKIPFYYHHVIWHNAITRKYLQRFGLIDSCKWKNIKVAIGVNGKLSNINEIAGLLGFNYLNLYEKIRFGMFGLYTIFLMKPELIPEEMDAKAWLYKYAGKGVADKVFYNLYGRNKFNTDLDIVSAKQFAHRLKERDVFDKFTFPRQGLQKMVDGLEASIGKKGGTIIKGANVTKIDLKKKCVFYDNKRASYDVLINTIQIPEFLKIAEGLPKDYVKTVSKVKYCPCVSITFATDDFLDRKNYWINLFQEDTHVVMQHSLLCDKYDGKVAWCLRYGGSGEDLDLSDEQIKRKYFKALEKYFRPIKPRWARVFREKYAEPIYDKDYSSYKPDYTTPVEGLYMAGIQVTHPLIRNMNSALISGEKVASIILGKH